MALMVSVSESSSHSLPLSTTLSPMAGRVNGDRPSQTHCTKYSSPNCHASSHPPCPITEFAPEPITLAPDIARRLGRRCHPARDTAAPPLPPYPTTLGRLAGSGRLLPDPHLLVNAYITREAVSSSRIEGTQASVTEVFDAAVTGETRRDDIREVRNYVAALNHGVRRLKEDGFPISLRLIKEMHKILLTGVRGQDKTPRRIPDQSELDQLSR
jgi:hypothetical protein